MRAGAHALTLVAAPLNIQVLTALDDGPIPLIDLRRAVGLPPQTTMRKQLQTLVQIGALERSQQAAFPGTVEYSLSESGRQLVAVARIAQDWLWGAPDGPLPLGTQAAKNSIKALVDGWSSTMVRALAARPLSLTELSRLISTVNYPSLERRLNAMRLAGQVARADRGGRCRPYSATPWLRRAVGPLAAAAQWERQFDNGLRQPLNRIDVECALLLSIPLVRLPVDLNGSARLVAELRRKDDAPSEVGVLVSVHEGEVVECIARLEGHADAWSIGSVSSWIGAMTEGGVSGLELGGDARLATSLVEGLHEVLRGAQISGAVSLSSAPGIY